jgi:hypothetical protein
LGAAQPGLAAVVDSTIRLHSLTRCFVSVQSGTEESIVLFLDCLVSGAPNADLVWFGTSHGGCEAASEGSTLTTAVVG